MATVRKQVTPKGKTFFQAVWEITGLDGKRKRLSKSFDKEKDAKAHAAKMAVEQESRNINDGGKLTFAKHAEDVLTHLRGNGELASTSINGYEYAIQRLVKVIGHLQIGKLTPHHIDMAFAKLRTDGGTRYSKSKKDGEKRTAIPLSERTMLHTYRLGALVMQHAVRWKRVAENPFKDVKTPKAARKKIKVMTLDEGSRVFEKARAASDKYPGLDLLVALLLTCGLRRSEVLGLAFDAIDLTSRTISIFRTVVPDKRGGAVFRDARTKSESSERTISFDDELVPMIERHRATISQLALAWGKGYKRDPLLLFPTFGGEPLAPLTLTTRLRQLHRQARVSGVMPSHGFRHGMASRMVANGEDVRTVADRLGHGTVSFTLQTYVHSVEGKDREAAKKLTKQLLPKL